MQRIVFCLVLFSFCMLSFSASCLALSKNKVQSLLNLSDVSGDEEENEKGDQNEKEFFGDICHSFNASNFHLKKTVFYYLPFSLPKPSFLSESEPPENF
jgi:hypothetical protein